MVANTNPIILDSRGEASVWFSAAKYKFVLKTAADVEIWTQDNLWAAVNVDGSNATGTWPISVSGSAASVAPGGAVNKIIAGSNITISPTSGVGDVTINAAATSGTVTSVTGAGVYGFTLTGGPITSTGTLTVTPPAPSTAGNVLTSNGVNWVSQSISSIPQSAKAWVNFDGTSGTIRSSYNVSSVTRNSTGYYTAAFTSALSNSSYSAVCSSSYPQWPLEPGTNTTTDGGTAAYATTSIQTVCTRYGNGAVDPIVCCIQVFGN